MFMPRRFWIRGTIIVGVISMLLIFFANSWAAETIQTDLTESREIQIAVDKSYVLPIPETIKESDHVRITIAAPDIADFLFIPKVNRKNRIRNIYIKGLKPGATNLTLWKNGNIFRIYDIAVNFDISLLKQKIHEILPDEKNIRIFATKDSITLSGTVSNAGDLDQVLVLAKAFCGKGNITNLLKVEGGQQVMLEVKIAEMSRIATKRMGINFSAVNSSGEIGINIIGGIAGFSDGILPTLGDNVTGWFQFDSPGHNVTYTGVIDFLKKNGLAKILAEPTLIALSGQTANFLAGGEFPIPDKDDDGNIGVTFKPYGVELAFLPTVLSDKRIAIKVEPAVTELHNESGTQIVGGAFVPGLLTRKASTMVELADGQTFSIAGLLRETTNDDISKYPGLGDIPILGALFRSSAFIKNETELVILVTPHLVKPLNMAEQTLPTDFYIEPDDAEFYIWDIFGQSHKNAVIGEPELEGEFGHIFEKTE